MRLFPLIAGLLLLACGAHAQAAAWTPPLTRDGVPDLQGVWTNASITTLTRPRGVTKLVFSPAEAEAFLKADPLLRHMNKDAAPTNPDSGAPSAGGDPGGYNAFWLDPGSSLGLVNGQFRTSWIVDTPDGQLPLSAQGKALVAEADVFARRADTPAGPEELEPWDRCLVSSRGSGGPGMLNNLYNSNYEIVQTRTTVAIMVEMIHDVRIIPLFPAKAAAQAGHRPAAIQPWLGDSVGWWEGDTLVVETTNVNAEQGRAGPIYLTPRGRVTERFRRVSAREIFYAFEVEDPTYYSRPWHAEMSLQAGKGLIYEYACHEGNYALPDILAGARAAEKQASGGGGSVAAAR
jgi:hypothetical protein